MLITDVDEKNGQRKHIAEYIEQASVISYRRTTVAIRLVAAPIASRNARAFYIINPNTIVNIFHKHISLLTT